MSAKILTFSSLFITGLGGSIFGADQFVKETIEQGLGNKKIPENNSNKGWSKLTEKFKTSSPESEPFIKEKQKANSDNYSLRDFCSKNLNTNYKNLFGTTKGLMSDFEKNCTISISEVIEESKFSTESSSIQETEKTNLKKKLQTLRENSDVQNNLSLNKELTALKNKTTANNEDEDLKKLLKECSNLYSSSFISEQDNNWKLIEKFCINK